MNLNHLKYFYDAVSEGSVSKAAQKNFVTQSAISQAIRKIEELLDCSVLHHGKNIFNLTDEGRLIFNKCHDLFSFVEELKDEVTSSKKELKGTVTLATSHSIALSVLPSFLRSFQKKYPLIKTKIKLAKTAVLKRWILDREIDFALTVDNGDLQETDSITVKEGQFVAITNRDSIATSRGFIITEERSETIKLKQHYQKTEKKSLPVIMEVDSWEVIQNFAKNGLGIGYLPDFTYQDRSCKIIEARFLPKTQYRIVAFHRKGLRKSKSQEVFFNELVLAWKV